MTEVFSFILFDDGSGFSLPWRKYIEIESGTWANIQQARPDNFQGRGHEQQRPKSTPVNHPVVPRNTRC